MICAKNPDFSSKNSSDYDEDQPKTQVKNMWRIVLATLFVMMFSMGSSLITIPLALNLAGFWPSILSVLVSWLYILLTSLYYLEATLSMPPGANVYSISKRYIPPLGIWLNVIVFFAVNYSIILLYDYLGIPILAEILKNLGIHRPSLVSYLTFGIIFGLSLCLGLRWALILNAILTLFYVFFLYMTFSKAIDMPINEPTTSIGLDFLALVIPSLLNSLYMQTLIPTIAPYLDYDRKKLKWVIISGLILSFLIFSLWLRLVIRKSGSSFEHLDDLYPNALDYKALSSVPHIGTWLPYLTVATLASSVIITIVILVDFFSDWMDIALAERKGAKRLVMTAALFLPALFAPLIKYGTVLDLLDLIADIGAIYLCGLMPIWWIWSLRYKYAEPEELSFTMKGRGLLLVLTLISFFIFYLVGLEFIYTKFT